MKQTVLTIIIIILVALIASGTTYLIMINKNDNKVNETTNNTSKEQDNKVEDGVKLISTKKSNDTIIQKYQVVLNGKEKELELKYYCEDVNKEMPFMHLVGKINNRDYIKYEAWYDDEQDFNNIFSEENIDKQVNSNNFYLIKGTDNKNYLGFIGYKDTYNLLYIFNDNLELITNNILSYNGYMFSDNGTQDAFIITRTELIVTEVAEKNNISYGNTFNLKDVDSELSYYVKIVDNKIYNLVSLFNEDIIDGSENGKLEERVYTINNNKLEYEVINTYTITKTINMI